MRPELLKGHLDSLLLSTLLDGAAHGYAIIEQLKAKSGGAFDLPEGTVYPALHRLEEAGLLTSDWESVSGRRRRRYAITKSGRKSLISEREEWKQFEGAINAVLGRKPWPTAK